MGVLEGDSPAYRGRLSHHALDGLTGAKGGRRRGATPPSSPISSARAWPPGTDALGIYAKRGSAMCGSPLLRKGSASRVRFRPPPRRTFGLEPCGSPPTAYRSGLDLIASRAR